MLITEAMLQAAIDKAVEAGLLPKYARKDQSAVDREILKLVLQAALEADASSPGLTRRQNPSSSI